MYVVQSVRGFFSLFLTRLAVQEYVCPAQGSHVICTCCFQPMPDRRAEREQNPHVAPQQCVYFFSLGYRTKSLFILIKHEFILKSVLYLNILYLDSCSDSMKESSFIKVIIPL